MPPPPSLMFSLPYQCTNFTCCNILLPDLHALLDHYELSPSEHSIIHTSPPTPSLSSSPASSPPSTPDSRHHPKSFLHSLPNLLCPSKNSIQSEIFGNDDATVYNLAQDPYDYPSDLCTLSDYPTYEHCYYAATASLSTQPPSILFAESQPSPLTNRSLSSSPSSRTRNIPAARVNAKGRRGRPPSLHISLEELASSSSLPMKKAKKARGGKKVETTGPGATLVKGGCGRRKEKAYPCPVRLRFLPIPFAFLGV